MQTFQELTAVYTAPPEDLPPRTEWIPMMDVTGLIIAVAWKNDEKLAWRCFLSEPEGSA